MKSHQCYAWNLENYTPRGTNNFKTVVLVTQSLTANRKYLLVSLQVEYLGVITPFLKTENYIPPLQK